MFKTIYYFNVIEAIKDGHTVYCIDRQERTIKCVNDMTIQGALRLSDAEMNDKSSRYEFYYKEERSV